VRCVVRILTCGFFGLESSFTFVLSSEDCGKNSKSPPSAGGGGCDQLQPKSRMQLCMFSSVRFQQ
jgi:hypothetical protein